jgi:hypothetical protein
MLDQDEEEISKYARLLNQLGNGDLHMPSPHQ